MDLTQQEPTAEEWREIKDYEGFYSVSNLGRVRRDWQSTPARNSYKGKILNPSTPKNKYSMVSLYRNGRGTTRAVHRLVAAAFLGPPPGGKQVNHIDRIKVNNRASNLEYCTPRENIHHSIGDMSRGGRHMSRTRPDALRRGEHH